VFEVQGEGPALGTQVPVPDHLRERHGHHEAPALQAQPARIQAAEGQIHARVARFVVVADQGRSRVDLLGVFVAAVVEVPTHAQHDLVQVDLQAGPELPAPAVVVLEGVGGDGQALGPLPPEQGVELEGEALLGLIDGGRLFLLRRRGHGGQEGEDQAGARVSHGRGDSSTAVGRPSPR
jgi:hypothetical protein